MKKLSKKPPKIAAWILNRIFKDRNNTPIADFEEAHGFYYKKYNRILAWAWCWVQVGASLKDYFKHKLNWSFVMFKNYLKIAFRHIKRQKMYSFINIAGLTLGLTVSILILLYIKYELSYDEYHKNADRIYRLGAIYSSDKTRRSAAVPAQVSPRLKESFSEIESSVRIFPFAGTVKFKNFLNRRSIFYSEPDIFDIFSFPILYGSNKSALNEPFSIFITEKIAEQYFGKEDPVGKTILLNNEFTFQIRGVLKNIPDNSHFKFDFLASLISLKTILGERGKTFLNRVSSNEFNTYIKLSKNVNISDFRKRLEYFSKTWKTPVNPEDVNDTFFIQSMKDIHLTGNYEYEIEKNNEISYIYLLAIISILILLIACFNYMNLTTARSAKKTKEIGLRKVIGADRKTLIKQFLGESFVFIMIAAFFSIILVHAALPYFEKFLNRNLNFGLIFDLKTIFILFGVLISVGFLSGFYPSLYLTSFSPVNVIKGTLKSGISRAKMLRNTLIIWQFIFTIALLTCTVIIYKQLEFIKDRSFGKMKDPILTLVLSTSARQSISPLKNEISKISGVMDVTASNRLPNFMRTGNEVKWDGQDESDKFIIRGNGIDYNFLDFYGLGIIKGRNFSKNISGDKENGMIINETAAKKAPFDEVIGKKLNIYGKEYTIIGIIKDFNFRPLTTEIEPLGMNLIPSIETHYPNANYLSVKVDKRNIQGIITDIEKIWKKFSPDDPIRHSFLDERVYNMYRSENRLGQSFLYLTVIAIFIACLGLFGLICFSTEQKTKEIGIRKVLGASVQSIYYLLSKSFLKQICLASLISFPTAYFLMNNWLNNFVYRVNIGFGTYILVIFFTLAITIISINYQAIKASRANPVDSLKYE